MIPELYFFILYGIVIFTLAFLGWRMSFLSKQIRRLYGNSFPSDSPQDLIRRLTSAEIKLEELEPRLELVESISGMSIHKVGFLRFNPFQDTGGDNSFVIALLDKDNSGILLSSLYTREGVRVYAKEVQMGRTRHLLSGEEKKVLEEAMEKTLNSKS